MSRRCRRRIDSVNYRGRKGNRRGRFRGGKGRLEWTVVIGFEELG